MSNDRFEQRSDMKPECPKCLGARFVYPKTPSGKIDYSRSVPCTCVAGTTDMMLKKQRLLDYSRLGTLRELNFDNLLPEGRHGDLQQKTSYMSAVEAARIFTGEPKGLLVFTGPSGSGKTHVLAAIVNELIASGKTVVYRSAPDMMDELRAGFSQGAEYAYADLFERLKTIPILVLDDFGVQNDSPWVREKLEQLLTYRNHQELPTVIATGVPFEVLDERVKNRINNAHQTAMFSLGSNDISGRDWAEGLELQKRMTFASFDRERLNLPLEEQENLNRAYKVAYDFARAPDGWLILQGVTGCGKTHLASSIVNYRYQSNLPALFTVVPEFLDHLRSTFTPDSRVSYDEIFDRVKTTPFLVLDDFGEHASTPWAQEKLYQVISYRYNAQLPTVITTRSSLDEIEPAISSRFIDHQFSMVFNITAPDYRGDTSRGKKAHSRAGNKTYYPKK
ncbi:ATP-binding protein [Candidatus Dehalogenimonas loeffleri]|uniref:ATP-binding protein n=1 Tax=Candidatus Dehalogenimonas loeffleri TaxID=3127115 RepID=A0ABZ2J867_9CHLR